jgi:hypothetical protein
MPDNHDLPKYDPEQPERVPILQGYLIADTRLTWRAVAEQFYKLDDQEAVNRAVDTLRAANPGIEEVVPGSGVAIPEVQGVPPLRSDAVPPQQVLFIGITIPELPVTEPPPDATAPISPPYDNSVVDIGKPQSFQDTIHPNCIYTHRFLVRHGPIQTREYKMGTFVWVKFLANLTTALGPASVTGLSAQYAVYEAPRLVVRTWQWQQIWDLLQRICQPGPTVEVRFVPLEHSGKWVLLPDRVVRGDPIKEIHSDYGSNADTRCVNWANDYQKTSPTTIVRGPDEI